VKKVTFLGDAMCDNSMAVTLDKYINDTTNCYDFESVFSHLKSITSMSDYVIANLETPITASREKLTKRKWTFNTPCEFALALKRVGVNFVSTANNHCLDNGITGLKETLECLEKIGLDHCGTQVKGGKRYYLVNLDNTKIGILSYTYGTNAFSNNCYLPFKYRNCVNLLQEQEGLVNLLWKKSFRGHLNTLYRCLEKHLYPENNKLPVYEKRTLEFYRKICIIKDLFSLKTMKPDYVIALLHIGGQYNESPSTYTKETTKWFLNRGCDVVICNHEHVVHGSYFSNNQFAAYALGNCLGGAGVIREPYDKKSEYSIALHLYLDKRELVIQKISFSVLRTILGDHGKLEVWPVIDLHDSEYYSDRYNEKEILIIANQFSGLNYDTVCKEFVIYEK